VNVKVCTAGFFNFFLSTDEVLDTKQANVFGCQQPDGIVLRSNAGPHGTKILDGLEVDIFMS